MAPDPAVIFPRPYLFPMRYPTRQIHVGSLPIGGDAPIAVQSMCSTPAEDAPATLAQIGRLAQAGCQLVRVAYPSLSCRPADHSRSRILLFLHAESRPRMFLPHG